jgi:hypothetical protein
MMENGLYPLNKLQVVLLHLLQIKTDGVAKAVEAEQKEDPYSSQETQSSRASNEELVLDSLIKFWNKALPSWVPGRHFYDVSKWISGFLLRKTVLTRDKKL